MHYNRDLEVHAQVWQSLGRGVAKGPELMTSPAGQKYLGQMLRAGIFISDIFNIQGKQCNPRALHFSDWVEVPN